MPGEIPWTRSGDGKPVDAYVMGPETPLDAVEGRVVAVVARDDDNEDKLVVATGDEAPTAAEIWQAVVFQERYFRSRLILDESHDRIASQDNARS